MAMKMVQNVDVHYLDAVLLDDDGFLRPIPNDELEEVPNEHLTIWCVKNAVYQLPTLELINFLKEKIAGRKAIEICSGRGHIARLLEIKATDNYMQTRPEILAYYLSMGQMPIVPPDFVEKMDAIEAIRKYNPEIVIGCFVTHKWENGLQTGNEFGPDERKIIEVADYIMVGNDRIHWEKPIRQVQHEELYFPWLRSRAFDQDRNCVMIWES